MGIAIPHVKIPKVNDYVSRRPHHDGIEVAPCRPTLHLIF
jgi:hypothetical protein